MTTFEAMSHVIDRYNSNPFNAKKFYYQFSELVDKDNRTRFEIKFGVSHNQSITLVDVVMDGEDKGQVKERIYRELLEYIFTHTYFYLDNITI